MKVTTQAELDAALINDAVTAIEIYSPAGVWLDITDDREKYVRAYGSSTVRAYGSSTVTAYGSSTVTASDYVAVHKLSTDSSITGGVVIDRSALNLSVFETWAKFHGVVIQGDEAFVFKAVNDSLKSARGFSYPIGEYVEAADWAAGDFCGNGLHFSPHPHHALYYYEAATRFLKVAVKLASLTVINGNGNDTPKLKAKGCRVIAEVTIDGEAKA